MSTYRDTEVILEEIKKARDNKDAKKTSELITEMLRPEAKEVVELSRKELMSKDGYIKVWHLVAKFPKIYQTNFLTAMALEGYPLDTLEQIKELLNQ